jgi:hypothetical protein
MMNTCGLDYKFDLPSFAFKGSPSPGVNLLWYTTGIYRVMYIWRARSCWGVCLPSPSECCARGWPSGLTWSDADVLLRPRAQSITISAPLLSLMGMHAWTMDKMNIFYLQTIFDKWPFSRSNYWRQDLLKLARNIFYLCVHSPQTFLASDYIPLDWYLIKYDWCLLFVCSLQWSHAKFDHWVKNQRAFPNQSRANLFSARSTVNHSAQTSSRLRRQRLCGSKPQKWMTLQYLW